MGPDELEWQDITDFSPGIYEDLNRRDATYKGGAAPDGACTGTTVGCRSASGGGLIGAPKVVNVWYLDSTPECDEPTPDIWKAVYSPAPTAPPLADHFLIDFDVVPGEHWPNRTRYDTDYDVDGTPAWYSQVTSGGLDNTSVRAWQFGVVWEGWGNDTSAGDATFFHTTRTRQNAEYKATYVGAFRFDSDQSASFSYNGTSVDRKTYMFPLYASGPHATSAPVVSSQKKVGWAGMNSQLIVDNSEPVSGSTRDQWQFGSMGWRFYLYNIGDKADYNVDTGMVANWGIQNTPLLHAGHGYIGGRYDLGNEEGQIWLAFDPPDQPVIPTIGCIHSNQLVLAVAPTVYAGLDQSGDGHKSPYRNDKYWGGYETWHWTAQAGHLSNLHLHWTEPLNSLDFETGVVDNELQAIRTAGYTTITSLTSINAAKLFITTANRGALVYEGDLNNPNIVRLPSVESTYGLTPHPTPVAGGVAYGSTAGIFLWDGGEQSQHLSPQLHGKFWVPDDMDLNERWREAAPRGRMGYRWPYLYVPNGYMMDMEQGGWWKLGEVNEDGYKFSTYRVDSQGTVWAARHKHDTQSLRHFQDPDQNPVSVSHDDWPIAQIDPDMEQNSWYWQSHPLLISRTRSVEIREVSMVIQTKATSGTMQVIMGNDNDSLAFVKNIDFADFTPNVPRTINFPVALTGTNQWFSFNVNGNQPTKVHRFSFGWRAAERQRQYNT